MKKKQIKVNTNLKVLSKNIFSPFSRTISGNKRRLKSLIQIYTCFLTSEGLVIETKIHAYKN